MRGGTYFVGEENFGKVSPSPWLSLPYRAPTARPGSVFSSHQSPLWLPPLALSKIFAAAAWAPMSSRSLLFSPLSLSAYFLLENPLLNAGARGDGVLVGDV